MRDFRSLDAWHKAHALTLAVHRATMHLPKPEPAALAATMCRWSAGMTMKIAEACGRDAASEYVASLRQCRGFATELEYQPLLGRDLRLLQNDLYDPMQTSLLEMCNMLTGLIRSQAV